MTTLAFLIEGAGLSRALSPVFAHARWLVRLDTESGREVWMDNRHRDAAATAGAVIRLDAERLVCTWIEPGPLRLLRARGIDVRLAPPTLSALAALDSAEQLPAAWEWMADSRLG
jgi:predicted Fe-Mo cluster-binding NifX family protein